MPYKFQTISGGDMKSVVNQVNKNFQSLDQEGITKSFKGPNNTKSIVQGRLPNGKYGQIYYDNSGIPRILIGQSPNDGRMGIWVSNEGVDVLSLLV